MRMRAIALVCWTNRGRCTSLGHLTHHLPPIAYMLKSTQFACAIASLVLVAHASDCRAQTLIRSSPSTMLGRRVVLDTTAAALSAFRPTVALADSGFDCATVAVGSTTIPSYIAYYPDRRRSFMEIAMWLNADGSLSHTTETRSSTPSEPVSGTIAPAVRDSIFQARRLQLTQTFIVLDFAQNTGASHNVQPGADSRGVSGSRAAIDSISALNQPSLRVQRALALCTGSAPPPLR